MCGLWGMGCVVGQGFQCGATSMGVLVGNEHNLFVARHGEGCTRDTNCKSSMYACRPPST